MVHPGIPRFSMLPPLPAIDETPVDELIADIYHEIAPSNLTCLIMTSSTEPSPECGIDPAAVYSVCPKRHSAAILADQTFSNSYTLRASKTDTMDLLKSSPPAVAGKSVTLRYDVVED
jgi:hypothetical protein